MADPTSPIALLLQPQPAPLPAAARIVDARAAGDARRVRDLRRSHDVRSPLATALHRDRWAWRGARCARCVAQAEARSVHRRHLHGASLPTVATRRSWRRWMRWRDEVVQPGDRPGGHLGATASRDRSVGPRYRGPSVDAAARRGRNRGCDRRAARRPVRGVLRRSRPFQGIQRPVRLRSGR